MEVTGIKWNYRINDSNNENGLCIAASLGHERVVEELFKFSAPLRFSEYNDAYASHPVQLAIASNMVNVVRFEWHSNFKDGFI